MFVTQRLSKEAAHTRISHTRLTHRRTSLIHKHIYNETTQTHRHTTQIFPVYIHTHTHKHTHIYTHTIHTCTIHPNTYIQIYAHMRAPIDIHTHRHTHTHTYEHTHIHTQEHANHGVPRYSLIHSISSVAPLVTVRLLDDLDDLFAIPGSQ